MSAVSSIMAHHATKAAVFRRLVQPVTNGVPGTKSYVRYKTVDAIYWKGGISKRYISEKLQPDVTGVVIVNPVNIAVTEIQDTGRIDICGIDIGGAINKVGGYSAGTSVIDVDGIADSALPIKKGDTFYITGETGLPEHTVASVTATPTTGITFTPVLASPIADDAVITITPCILQLAIVQADDIALQGEAIMIPVKEWA